MEQSCRSVYCQVVSPSGEETVTDHLLLHSADKWVIFLRHRGEASEIDRPLHPMTKERSMTLKYEPDCQVSYCAHWCRLKA